MEAKGYGIDNTQVQMIMVIKLQQLQRDVLHTLTYQNLEQYLSEKLWKVSLPDSLHKAADDILNVTAGDIVKFLSRQAIIEGSQQNLSEFSDLIGGK